MDDVRFPGTYVVAVSGGVDSMALLDMLVTQSQQLAGSYNSPQKTHLIVAHFDHGIRSDSELDRKLVQDVAKKHQLPFIYHEGKLGMGTSEATARKARYDFLHSVRRASNARAIITAHHRDDVLETAILQLLRGGGRRGWSSLRSHPTLARPLLKTDKQTLRNYAKDQGLKWREDSTNTDTRYLRNFIRHRILPRLSTADKQKLLNHIETMGEINREIDEIITLQLHLQAAHNQIDRHWFIGLSHAVATEVMAAWLRAHGVQDFDKKRIERLTIAAKTYKAGQLADVDVQWQLAVHNDILALVPRDR